MCYGHLTLNWRQEAMKGELSPTPHSLQVQQEEGRFPLNLATASPAANKRSPPLLLNFLLSTKGHSPVLFFVLTVNLKKLLSRLKMNLSVLTDIAAIHFRCSTSLLLFSSCF